MLALLFPPGNYCLLCGRAGPVTLATTYEGRPLAAIGGTAAPLCTSCRRLIRVPNPRCRVCQRYLGGDYINKVGGRSRACRLCNVLGPPYLGLTSLGLYRGLLRWGIGRFKSRREPWLGQALGAQLAGALIRQGVRADYIVPVPPEPGRLRLRGYNPPSLLAAALGRHLQIPWLPLLRRRPGSPQAQLDQRQRWHLTAATYYLPRGQGGLLAGARVLLVDDVVTTGATLTVCSRLLLAAGAALVWCAAVADAPRWSEGPVDFIQKAQL